jgi:hypothetical protein
MKLITVALLAVGMFSNSMMAMAESAVPFRALMQTASAKPAAPPITASQDQSTAASTQPAHRPMTGGGKFMTGADIAICAIGGFVLVGTATLNIYASSSDKAKLYGVGGGALAGESY